MTVSGQQIAEAGMPTVPVFEVAPFAGIASVDSSACAFLQTAGIGWESSLSIAAREARLTTGGVEMPVLAPCI